jgi:hypothetical protein
VGEEGQSWWSKKANNARPDGGDFLVECDQDVIDEKRERGDWETGIISGRLSECRIIEWLT